MPVISSIKSRRLSMNLTQEWVADQIGVSQSHYSRLENGQIPVQQSLLKKIALVLKTTVENIQFAQKSHNTSESVNVFYDALLTEKDARIKQLSDEVTFLRTQICNIKSQYSTV